ncbi:hypothetical protein PI125_g23235, partial [Phytophthora idaei]
ESQYEFFAD